MLVTKNTLHTALLLFAVLSASACQERGYSLQHQSGTDKLTGTAILASGTGNGDGFEGRIIANTFTQVDPIHSCADLDAKGNPLPNATIRTFRTNVILGAQLVRHDCVSLSPVLPIDPTSITSMNDGTGKISYKGSLFAPDKTASNISLNNWNAVSGKIVPTPSPSMLLPDGITSSQLFSEDTNVYFHGVSDQENVTLADAAVTASLLVKLVSRGSGLQIADPLSTSPTQCGCWFNFNTNTNPSTYATGAASTPMCSSQPIGGAGWYLITVTCKITPTGNQLIVTGNASASSNSGIENSYLGSGNAAFYFGGGTLSW